MKKNYFQKGFGDFTVNDWLIWLAGLTTVGYFIIEQIP